MATTMICQECGKELESPATVALRERVRQLEQENARLRQVVGQADEYIPEVEVKLAAAIEFLALAAKGLDRPVFENDGKFMFRSELLGRLQTFLDDSANAAVVQRAQKAMRVLERAEALQSREISNWDNQRSAILVGAIAALLADEPNIVGADDPTLNDLTLFAPTDEPKEEDHA